MCLVQSRAKQWHGVGVMPASFSWVSAQTCRNSDMHTNIVRRTAYWQSHEGWWADHPMLIDQIIFGELWSEIAQLATMIAPWLPDPAPAELPFDITRATQPERLEAARVLRDIKLEIADLEGKADEDSRERLTALCNKHSDVVSSIDADVVLIQKFGPWIDRADSYRKWRERLRSQASGTIQGDFPSQDQIDAWKAQARVKQQTAEQQVWDNWRFAFASMFASIVGTAAI